MNKTTRNRPFADYSDFSEKRGMQLEMKRDKLLESYSRSSNPKTYEAILQISKECNEIWKDLFLRNRSLGTNTK